MAVKGALEALSACAFSAGNSSLFTMSPARSLKNPHSISIEQKLSARERHDIHRATYLPLMDVGGLIQ